MFSKLFHKDVFMPEEVRKEVERIQRLMLGFRPSRHFSRHCEAKEDRSHNMSADRVLAALSALPSNPVDAVEVEYGKDFHYFNERGWHVLKFVVRAKYDDDNDIVAVLSPDYRNNNPKVLLIRTAWINSHRDNHPTLNASRYCSYVDWGRTIK